MGNGKGRRLQVRDIGDEPATITNLDTRDAMEQRSFAPGDVVQLNSGGPKMTVLSEKSDWYQCAWYDMQNKLDVFEFPTTALRLADK